MLLLVLPSDLQSQKTEVQLLDLKTQKVWAPWRIPVPKFTKHNLPYNQKILNNIKEVTEETTIVLLIS